MTFGKFSDRSDNAKSPLVDLTVQCPTQIAIGLDGGSNTALLVSATLADSRVSTSLQPIADRIQGTLTFSHSQPHETNAPSVDHWPTHQVTAMTWLSTAHAAASDISMAPPERSSVRRIDNKIDSASILNYYAIVYRYCVARFERDVAAGQKLIIRCSD